ncbi:hypothetical protein HRF87_27900 [Bacillus sp. CRN 9]|nr:hypothetical protein [Bacillus sp. CRN 9]
MDENKGPITGYEGHYEITESGRVYSVKKKCIRVRENDEYGFHIVKLSKKGEATNYNLFKLWKKEFPKLPESMFKGAKEAKY